MHAVGVTVEREADGRAVLEHGSAQTLGMHRTAVRVDVATVGLGVAARRLRRRRPATRAARSRTRRRSRSRARRAGPRAFAPRARRRRARRTPRHDRCAPTRRPAAAGADARIVASSCSIARLDVVRQLAAAGREQLHAVVGPRVVARRDHRGRGTVDLREERDAGRRQHADRDRPAPLRAASPRHSAASMREPDSRVSRPTMNASPAEHPGRGPTERGDEFVGEISVGVAPDAVGPEPQHGRARVSASSTAAPCGPS